MIDVYQLLGELIKALDGAADSDSLAVPAGLLRELVNDFSPPPKIPAGRARVVSPVNMRRLPADPMVIRLLERGAVVMVRDTPRRRATYGGVEYSWVNIESADRRFGWVVENLLAPIAGGGFTLAYPVTPHVVTQPFGVNPADYKPFGLPGHEGIDFAAPVGTPVSAAADGTIYQILETPALPYGNNVRIKHAYGFQTIYAHLSAIRCALGQTVKAGDVIGLSGNTGNSSGPHLHLTLKREGATAAHETIYPADQIDPAPYFLFGTGGGESNPPAPLIFGVDPGTVSAFTDLFLAELRRRNIKF